jgi:hypothetical protein
MLIAITKMMEFQRFYIERIELSSLKSDEGI